MPEYSNLNEALEALYALQEKLSAYNHAMELISYDAATIAPKGTTQNRAHALAILSEDSYKLMTGEDTVSLLEFLDLHKGRLSEKDARIVYLAYKDIRDMKKIPIDEYVAYQRLLVEADDAWHRAKETSDFPLFEPYLEKIVDTERRFALYCAPEKLPYNYCLDKYESGLTMDECDKFFGALKESIVPLIARIGGARQLDDKCLWGHFDEQTQLRFSRELMELMGIDADHCTLGTTEHPFTTSIGSHHDVRITTNVDEQCFASSMFSVIHEGGHALYDMGSDDEYAYTLLDGGVSMGVHESQSRFYENMLGRSKSFIESVFPILCKHFPEQMKGYTAEDVYRAVNIVRPSLIRTEADEVTYCMHVMIRYELEKRMMDGSLKVHELPGEWNRLYKEYLGVDVPCDRDGVLQDTHWSFGGIGYFPSYALGSAYAAQTYVRLAEDVDVEACLRAGDLTPINEWNRSHIWRYGSLKDSSALMREVWGAEFDPTYYTRYLEQKYKALYNLK